MNEVAPHILEGPASGLHVAEHCICKVNVVSQRMIAVFDILIWFALWGAITMFSAPVATADAQLMPQAAANALLKYPPPLIKCSRLLPLRCIPRSLKDVPIEVGDAAFNEPKNRGFSEVYKISWWTEDLWLMTDGKIGGTFTTTYDGPAVPDAQFRDVLFIQIMPWYIWPEFGDWMGDPVDDPIPILATESTRSTAIFDLIGSFSVPPLVKKTDGGMPLDYMEVNLTWVRVYKSDRGYAYHIFPAYEGGYSIWIGNPPREKHIDTPTVTFNQLPRRARGEFLYYTVLPENRLSGVRYDWEFDYRAWLKANMRW